MTLVGLSALTQVPHSPLILQALEEVPGELNACAMASGGSSSSHGFGSSQPLSSGSGPALSLFYSSAAAASSVAVLQDPEVIIGAMQLHDRSHSMAVAARAATLATLSLQSDKALRPASGRV